jgi:hypothetical protein
MKAIIVSSPNLNHFHMHWCDVYKRHDWLKTHSNELFVWRKLRTWKFNVKTEKKWKINTKKLGILYSTILTNRPRRHIHFWYYTLRLCSIMVTMFHYKNTRRWKWQKTKRVSFWLMTDNKKFQIKNPEMDNFKGVALRLAPKKFKISKNTKS